jgi:hypothetical protein
VETAVLDPALGLELSDPDGGSLIKRNLSGRQTESLVLDSILTTFSSRVSPPRPGLLYCGNEDNRARTPCQSLNDLPDEEDRGFNAHVGETAELSHLLGRSTSPFKDIADEQAISPNLDGRRKNRKDGGENVRQSLEDEPSKNNDIARGALAKPHQRRDGDWGLKKQRGLLRHTLNSHDCKTNPTKTWLREPSIQSQQLPNPSTESASPCPPQTHFPETKARDGPSLTDLTLCPVPKGSAIVTATVRCRNLNMSLNLVALDYKLLGGEGKIIRIAQLSSPDLWIIIGYRDNNNAPSPCGHGSSLLNAD